MSGNISLNLKTLLIGIQTLKIAKSSEKTKNKLDPFITLSQSLMEKNQQSAIKLLISRSLKIVVMSALMEKMTLLQLLMKSFVPEKTLTQHQLSTELKLS